MEFIGMKREIKLRDFEVILLREGYFGKTICYMLIMDYRRKATLEDFPYLKGVEDQEEFVRKNYIKVVFVSGKNLTKKTKDHVIFLAQGLSEIHGDANWNCDFEIIDKQLFKKATYTTEEGLKLFEEISAKHGFKISLTTIPIENFDFLSQD